MNIPQIFFESGYLIDLRYDLDHPDKPIADESKPRVRELIHSFDQIWKESGGIFLAAAVDEIGLPFCRKELSCTVTVSPDQFSCSHPLIINAARFYSLSHFSEVDRLRFVDTLVHELLHRYLDDHFEIALDVRAKNASPLTNKINCNLTGVDLICAFSEAKHQFEDVRLARARHLQRDAPT